VLIRTADGNGTKDAKAVEAVAKFVEAARDRFGETNFLNREYGALLCEMSGGSIELGPIIAGPFVGPPVGGQGTVDIPPSGCGVGTPVGFVHTHMSGNPRPSPGDMGYLERLVSEANANPARLSAYVIGTYSRGTGQEGENRVSVAPLSDKEKVEDPDYEPAWVNPDAKPCPANEL
jgi:hypothetical protein